MAMNADSISRFTRHHYRHFNAAALVDAADAYRAHLDGGGIMLMTPAQALLGHKQGHSRGVDEWSTDPSTRPSRGTGEN